MLSGGENENVKHATRKLVIRSTPECGNFVAASESMRAGETIVVEKPIAACLLPKYFGSHCLHCLRRYVHHHIISHQIIENNSHLISF